MHQHTLCHNAGAARRSLVHVLVDGFVNDALHLLGEGAPVLFDVLLFGFLFLLLLHFLQAEVEGVDVLPEQRVEPAQAGRGPHDAGVEQSGGALWEPGHTALLHRLRKMIKGVGRETR